MTLSFCELDEAGGIGGCGGVAGIGTKADDGIGAGAVAGACISVIWRGPVFAIGEGGGVDGVDGAGVADFGADPLGTPAAFPNSTTAGLDGIDPCAVVPRSWSCAGFFVLNEDDEVSIGANELT